MKISCNMVTTANDLHVAGIPTVPWPGMGNGALCHEQYPPGSE